MRTASPAAAPAGVVSAHSLQAASLVMPMEGLEACSHVQLPTPTLMGAKGAKQAVPDTWGAPGLSLLLGTS